MPTRACISLEVMSASMFVVNDSLQFGGKNAPKASVRQEVDYDLSSIRTYPPLTMNSNVGIDD